jgi:CheY-like chemotaxis protein
MILIAEDHDDSRDALRTLLEAVDYRVCLAANGQEAVESAMAHHPDLILMDIMMPGVDGLEATRTLRSTPGFQDIPILALTALEGAKEQVLAAGCDEYIAKPINVRALLAKVRTWMETGRPAGA